MEARIRFTMGSVEYNFAIDEKDEMETLHKAIVLANPPRYCHCCQNTEKFNLATNKDKEGNTYISVQCINPKCFAKAKLGQYKAGGYFWHKFEQWKKEEVKKENTKEAEW